MATPPEEPWFNVWVLNQSDATVDSYSLEITLREDVDGNGWTNGAENSVQLAASFTSTGFNDEWVLISAPLSSLTNLGTGGNGSFDGNLDEVVIVVAGVAGASGAVVEVDFDQLSFTSGGPLISSTTVFDDMEHADPFGNGWFAFNGSVGGGNGVLNAIATTNGGNGQLINAIVVVAGNTGSDVNFVTDYWTFSNGPLA